MWNAPLYYRTYQSVWNSLYHSATPNMGVKAPCALPAFWQTRSHPPALGADLHLLCFHSSSAAFASIVQEEYLCYRNIYTILFQLLLCRSTFLCRSALNRSPHTVLQPPCVQTHSITAPTDPRIKAVLLQCDWIKPTDWPFPQFCVFRSLHHQSGEGLAVVFDCLWYF